jgi:SAM-dependent methyltransferase
MNVLKWAWQSIRGKSVLQTVKVASNFVLDLFFDWRHGTDTMRRLDRDRLDARSENQRHSARYGATKVGPFLRLLTQLDLPRDSNFVDIGAGKGRVLLMAAQYGFRKVIGIEFSGRLCAIARNNVELFRRKSPLQSPIEVIEADAAGYSFHAEDRVLFMYNPFDSVILAQVLDNLRRSLDEKPRPIWLIYNTPKFHDVVVAARLFKSDTFFEIGGNHFRVYRN